MLESTRSFKPRDALLEKLRERIKERDRALEVIHTSWTDVIGSDEIKGRSCPLLETNALYHKQTIKSVLIIK